MSILSALREETVLRAALALVESGLSVVPVQGKVNAVSWSRLQTERPTPGLVHWWDWKGKLSGVAVICGRVSGNLVVVDCDGDEAVATYEREFPHLLNTLTVRSGSGHGAHYYYVTEEYTPTTRTKGWELRSDGCYVVAPPSKHPVTRLAYRVVTHTEPRRLNSLEPVQAWIARKAKANRPAPVIQQQPISAANRYAAAALRNECQNVTSAQLGERNNTLYRAALRLGNLIDMNMISRWEVENALMNAAHGLSSDDGESRSRRTIQSGIERGIRTNNRKKA